MLADSADYTASTYSSKSSKQIGNYLFIAPFNGVVTGRNVHEGAYVGTPNENQLLRLKTIPVALTSAIRLDRCAIKEIEFIFPRS
jgi:hypothetical protein